MPDLQPFLQQAESPVRHSHPAARRSLVEDNFRLIWRLPMFVRQDSWPSKRCLHSTATRPPLPVSSYQRIPKKVSFSDAKSCEDSAFAQLELAQHSSR